MFSKYEQKCLIKIQIARGKNARQCHTALLEACGRETLPYRTVAWWAHTFRREFIKKRGAGKPQSASDDVHVNAKSNRRGYYFRSLKQCDCSKNVFSVVNTNVATNNY